MIKPRRIISAILIKPRGIDKHLNMLKFSMDVLSEQSISQAHGIRLLLHHHVGIDLRGVDAGMPKKFARRVDVCPGCHGHGGKGVAAGVEGDKLVDSGTFRHGLQSPVGSTQFRSVGENQLVACIFRSLRHPRLCLLPQRNDDGMLGLLHGRHKYHLAFVSLANVLPSECCHVTMSQPCETAEHESLLGAKCNNIQVDGMSFIEKLSFNAFNEGTRLEHCVKLAEKLFGEKITKLGGDCSYSGNDNRSFCSEKGIVTSFAQKGKIERHQHLSAWSRKNWPEYALRQWKVLLGHRRNITG